MPRYFHSTLTRKGQATIPIEIREALGLQEGDRLMWRLEGGQITVRSGREHVRRTAGMLKPFIDSSIPSPSEEEMDEAIASAIVEDYLTSENRI